jgi:hypothetical protein
MARRTDPHASRRCWFFNTNESWGAGAFDPMFKQSVIALYGYPEGVGVAKLHRPAAADRVFAYVNGSGIVATGLFEDAAVFAGSGVFGGNAPREYHRKVDWEHITDLNHGISSAEAREWGWNLPVRCTVAEMDNRQMTDRILRELARRAATNPYTSKNGKSR